MHRSGKIKRGAVWTTDKLEPRRLLAGTAFRIDSGGSAFTDSTGAVWTADYGFTGGSVSHSAFAVGATTADPLYYNYRSGNFTYAWPVVNGTYTIRMLFTEPTMTAKSKRVFNIFAEGKEIQANLDLYATGGLKNAITKTYAVAVADGQLNLSFSGVVNSAIISAMQLTPISVAAPMLPVAPVAIGAVANSSSTITVSWSAVSGVSSYLVERSISGSGIWTSIGPASGITKTSYLDSNLAAATPYSYQIFSQISAVVSVLGSNIVSATTAVAAPASPDQPTLDLEPDPSVTVSWNAVDDADTYTVQRSLTGLPGSWTSIYTTPDNATLFFVDPNVAPDVTTYYYQVLATNAGGDSPPSPLASTPPVQAYVPGTLTASAVSGSASISLSWGASSNATSYDILRSLPDTGSGFDWQPVNTVTAPATTYIDPNLDSDTTYVYEIVAENSVIPSPAGNSASATTVPSAPDPLNVVGTTYVNVSLNWADVAGETGFSIERNGAVVGAVGQGTLAFTDKGAQPGTTYSYRVRAISIAGFSGYTLAQSATTLGTSKLLDVGGGAFTDSSGNQWQADTGAGWTGGTVSATAVPIANTTDDYLYYTNRSGNMSYTLPADNGVYTLSLYFADPTSTGPNQRWFSVTAQGSTILTNIDLGKVPGVKTALVKTFTINITTGQLNLAFITGGGGAIVSAISLKPNPPPPPPSDPTAFAATPVSAASVRLTWAENPTSSVSSFTILRYDPVAQIFSPIGSAPASARQYLDGQLPSNSQYEYEIQAIGLGGPSDISSPVSAATLSPLSSPWLDADIGAVGIGGGSATDGSSFTLAGSGADMFKTADAYHFMYQPITGDVTIITRVASEQSTDPWARAGLVLSQGLATSSAMAGIFMTPGNGVAFQNRLTSGASTAGLVNLPAAAPIWLKLVRNVNTVVGYFSADGITWTQAGSQTFASAASVYVGLCVSAHNNALLNTSTFDNVSVTTSTPFQWINGANQPITTFESPNAVVGDNLYVFGGFYDAAIQATTQSEVYNVDTNTWSLIAPEPIAVTHAGVAVVGSDIYFAGGFVGNWPSTITSQFMKYSTTTNSWTVLTPLPAARGAGGMVLLGDQLHFFGGLNATKTADMGDQWVYDLDNPTAGWTSAAPMPDPRNHIGFIALNGLAYAIGGQHLLDEDHSNQSEVDAYDPATNTWTAVAPLPVARSHNHTATFAYDGKIIIITGQENGVPNAQTVADAMAYDPASNTWTMLPFAAPAVREAADAKVIGNTLIVTGGANQAHVPQSTTWLGDLSTIFALPSSNSSPASGLSIDGPQLSTKKTTAFDELPPTE